MGAFVKADLTVLDVVRAGDAGFRGSTAGLAAKANFDLLLPLPGGIERKDWKPRLVVYYRGENAALLAWVKGEVHKVTGTVEAVRFDGHGNGEDWRAVSTVTAWVVAGGEPDAEVDAAVAGPPEGPVLSNQRGNVVFICDATGTMINKFATLRAELTKAVESLKPAQSFNIVFFYDGAKAVSVDRRESLLVATPDNKRRAYQFLDGFQTTGQTDPLPGIRLAFKMQPQLIYFLSDGEFNNLVPYEQVVAEIGRLNRDRKARINTIQFGKYDKQAEEVLKKIASEHGGSYRFVSEADLVAETGAQPRAAPGPRPTRRGQSIFQEN